MEYIIPITTRKACDYLLTAIVSILCVVCWNTVGLNIMIKF